VDPVGEGEDLVEGGQNRALVVGDLLAPDRCPGFVDRGKPVMGFTGVDPDPEAVSCSAMCVSSVQAACRSARGTPAVSSVNSVLLWGE
jgi:hypothetical protein